MKYPQPKYHVGDKVIYFNNRDKQVYYGKIASAHLEGYSRWEYSMATDNFKVEQERRMIGAIAVRGDTNYIRMYHRIPEDDIYEVAKDVIKDDRKFKKAVKSLKKLFEMEGEPISNQDSL